jgi:C1A family cysteine protease
MKSFTIAALAAVSTAKVLNQDYSNFVGFIAKHGKAYASLEEYNFRYDIYMQLDAEIRHLNITEKSSRHGHNFMSDFTREEYTARLGRKGMKLPKKSENLFEVKGELSIPASVDWRTVNPAVVNAVKDQGQCGSCWAFASTSVMESAHAIAKGVLLSLSEQ